jgi:hypothetical protein
MSKEIKHQITGDMYIEWPPVKAKQEQGEPVAWVNSDDLYDLEAGEDGDVPYVVRGNEQPKNMPKSIPLYTTPQPAQKPLSEAAIEGLAKFVAVDDFNYDFARTIEKAHGIKENT